MDVVPPTQNLQDNDEDEGAAAGPRLHAQVRLTKTITHKCLSFMDLPSLNNSYTTGQKVDASELADEINQPNLVLLIRQFLQDQLRPNSNSSTPVSSSPAPSVLPFFNEPISIYTSAVAMFYAPSDLCGTQGMHRECIHAVDSWRKGPGRYDCVFVNTNPTAQGILGLDIACAQFFSLKFHGKFYPCVLLHWFSRAGDSDDENTGMWVIHRDPNADGSH